MTTAQLGLLVVLAIIGVTLIALIIRHDRRIAIRLNQLDPSAEVRVLATAIIDLIRDHLKLADYSHENVHELRGAIEAVAMKREVVLELVGKVDSLSDRLDDLATVVRHIDAKGGHHGYDDGK